MPSLENIRQNVSLAAFTTLKIGGPARLFVEIGTEDELLEAIAFAGANDIDIFGSRGRTFGCDGALMHCRAIAIKGIVVDETKARKDHYGFAAIIGTSLWLCVEIRSPC